MWLIDSHEPRDIIESVKAEFHEIQVVELGDSSGDALWQGKNGTLIVERKTPEDLAASIADGRLFRQADRIPTLCRFPFLVVDGEWNWQNGYLATWYFGKLQQSNWRRESITSALRRVQALGMIVEQTAGLTYAKRIGKIAEWCEDKADEPHALHKQRVTTNPLNPTIQRRVDFLANLPGIGLTKALSIVKTYGNETRLVDILTQLVNLSDFGDAPKLVGPKTIGELRQLLEMRESEILRVDELGRLEGV